MKSSSFFYRSTLIRKMFNYAHENSKRQITRNSNIEDKNNSKNLETKFPSLIKYIYTITCPSHIHKTNSY